MKNIILLSDGTGNGAAKRHHTNVWRLYNALNLHHLDQVAFFDDGVGSQEFLPFKLLGGIFGWGLKRNVLDLYKFLCRNYQPGTDGEPGDRIYLFGFSRGAFTVRVLTKMIEVCGLYTNYTNEQDLDKTARKNYGIYRNRYKHGFLTQVIRAVAHSLTGERKIAEGSHFPDIEFIGVWDTVDAFGFPIDELATLWDLLISPIRLPNLQLSVKIKKACHALSIDDERHTFHPVLWDESREESLVKEGKVSASRLEQVWFSGVHSDVGGGYPRHSLSLVTLDWMISKLRALEPGGPELVFIPQKLDEYHKQSDWHGKQHNSRAILAAYYRYKPRNIEQLCNNPEAGVLISKPKIHRAVLERIKSNCVAYAPTGLPASYQIVSTQVVVPSYGTAPVLCYETESQAWERKEAMNSSLDIIYWRRWLYGALMVTTIALIASRFFSYLAQYIPFLTNDRHEATNSAESVGLLACLVDSLLQFAIDNLPKFAEGWFETLRQNHVWFWGFIAAFAVLLIIKRILWHKTQQKAMAAWAKLKGKGAPLKWQPTVTSRLRGAAYSKFRKTIKWMTASAVFVLLLVLLPVILYMATSNLCKP